MIVVGSKWVFKIKRRPIGLWSITKPGWLPRVFINNRDSTFRRHLIRMLNPRLFGSFYLLLYLRVGLVVSLMSRIPSFIGFWLRLYACLHRWDLLLYLIQSMCANIIDLFVASTGSVKMVPSSIKSLDDQWFYGLQD